jgi:hypothetical protein
MFVSKQLEEIPGDFLTAVRSQGGLRGAEPIETASEFEIVAIHHRWILKLSNMNMCEIDSYV